MSGVRRDRSLRIPMVLRRLGILLVLSLVLMPLDRGVAGPPHAGLLTGQEKRGKQIYVRGSSPSGRPIAMIIGNASLDPPSTTLPCANCHGLDGRGKPEGGVEPSNIVWEFVSKPYGITHTSGRKHPPYTERLLERAITVGLDPAGQPLVAAMPRYRMSREDMADLLAYLKRLGNDQDPGLTETAIRVGTILPTKGSLADLGQAMRAVLTAYFAEINGQGGIYNRRLELRVVESGEGVSDTRTRVEHFLGREEVFALTGAWIAGAEKELAALIEREEVPLVGPFTLFPQIGFPLNRQIFYLLPGLKDQARVLVEFAVERLGPGKRHMALIHPESEMFAEITGAIEEQGKKAGWSTATKFIYPHGRFDAGQVIEVLSQDGANVVFFLDAGGATKALLQEAAQRQWLPAIFLLGSLAGAEIFEIPGSFTDKVFLAFPTLPSDQTRAGVMEYRTLMDKHKLPARHLVAQLSTYASAKVLVEGLKRAGKELSREKLIATLEGLYEFDTGVTPRITYGPNRRIGAVGAYVVGVDVEKKAFIPLRPWMTLE